MIIAIYNSPSSIIYYKAKKADGTWVTRNTSQVSGDVKIRIDTDGVNTPTDSTLLILSENTNAMIVFGDLIFSFRVGEKNGSPNTSPDTKIELDYNTPQTTTKCIANVGFTFCEFVYSGKVITVDQEFNSSSAGKVKVKSGTSVDTTDGSFKKVPYRLDDYISYNSGLSKISVLSYSFISTDSVGRYYHDWLDEGDNVRSFDYIKSAEFNSQSSNYKATQQPKYTFTPYTKIDGVLLTGSNTAFKLIDPWYVNSNYEQKPTEVLNISSDVKIFRDQSPDPLNSSKPFYKVKKSTDFSGIPLQFSQWSSTNGTIPQSTANGNGEYPLVFSVNQTSFNTTAEYKGLLTSNTSNWVQTNMVNFSGKNAVVYKSMNELWYHREAEGVGQKEIRVALSSEMPSAYSVLQNGSSTYISYVNNLGKIIVRKYDFNGNLLSTTDLNNTVLPAGAAPKLLAGGYWVIDPVEPDNTQFTQYITVFYQEGTSVKFRNHFVASNTWAGSWSSNNLSSYLTSSTAVQSATNGQYGYLFWTNGTTLYSNQFSGSFGSTVTVANQSYLASNIFSVAGAVNSSGNLTLAFTQQRGTFSNVFTRTVYPDGNMNTESVADMTYTPNNPPTQYYYPTLMVSEGSNLLLEIGKTAYYSSPWYIFWRHDGSTWKKQSWAASPVSLKKLLHGETDDYPKETAISSLYKLDVAPVTTLGALNKINEGNRNSGSPYFSIVAQNLTDSNSFYIDLEPSSVDSIVVDTLNIWHIVLKSSSVSAELVSDLNHWGTATFTESNKTVVFSPNYETRYYYTIDPSSNSARMNKTNAEKDQEENETISENGVSVFPNPFNPTTQIKIQIKEKSYVTIEVYNLVGQQVMSEIRNGVQGEIVVPFNGSHLSSGTYFYQVSINDKVFKGKLNLVK